MLTGALSTQHSILLNLEYILPVSRIMVCLRKSSGLPVLKYKSKCYFKEHKTARANIAIVRPVTLEIVNRWQARGFARFFPFEGDGCAGLVWLEICGRCCLEVGVLLYA